MAQEPLTTKCRKCGQVYSIEIEADRPVASASCTTCLTDNYVSRYERIDIGLTEVCNLACKMCRRPQEREFMSPEKVERYFFEAYLIGIRTISFSGGEPFAHPQFRDFLASALGHGFDVELVTNGTLVRSADIQLLERLKCVTVSVDGPRDVHDSIRGKVGAWDRTMSTLAMLAKSKAKWGTNTVIQEENAAFILDTWRAILGAGRPAYVAFTHVEVVPETRHLQPTEDQAFGIKRQLQVIREECRKLRVHFNDEALTTRLYDIFADKTRRYRPVGGCKIPRTFLGVSQYGVFPCWHQGRSIKCDGLIEALETDLCRDIVREGLERRCVGCNAANYSWSEEWIEGIAEACENGEWSEGVVYLSVAERAADALSQGRRTLPLLERRHREA